MSCVHLCVKWQTSSEIVASQFINPSSENELLSKRPKNVAPLPTGDGLSAVAINLAIMNIQKQTCRRTLRTPTHCVIDRGLLWNSQAKNRRMLSLSVLRDCSFWGFPLLSLFFVCFDLFGFLLVGLSVLKSVQELL